MKKREEWYVPTKKWQITEDYEYIYENSALKIHCFKDGKSLCSRYKYQDHFRKVFKKDINSDNTCKACYRIWKRKKRLPQINTEIDISQY